MDGLDAMWPRIHTEIARARRRERLRRRLPAWTAIAATAGFSVGFTVLWTVRRPDADARSQSGPVRWDLADIAPVGNVSSEYPLVRGNSVCAIRRQGRTGYAVCIRGGDGAVAWRSPMAFAECRMGGDESRLYLLHRAVAGAWRCAALDLRDGRIAWQRPEETDTHGPPSPPSAAGDRVTWSQGNRVTQCHARDGTTRWTWTAQPGERLSAPRAQGETVFALSRRDAYALRGADGRLLWSRRFGDVAGAGSDPALLELDDERVFAACRMPAGAARLFCLSAESGELLWTAPSDAPTRLQADAGQLYVRSESLTVLDARSGAPRWRAPLGGCGPIAFGPGRLYVVNSAGRRGLMALDARSGRASWRRDVAGSCSGVVLDTGVGYLSGHDGVLHALAL
jgi:outer membrane protein assembly factor BamB